MIYRINDMDIPEDILIEYINKLVDRIFAILEIYEDCDKTGDFLSYRRYLNRVISELSGGYYIIGGQNFLSISNILTGMYVSETMKHEEVKSLVFHCISLVKKILPKGGDA